MVARADIVAHGVVQPVHDEAIEHTFEQEHERLLILGVDRGAAEALLHVAQTGIVADARKLALVGLAAAGIADVQHGAPVFHGEIHRRVQTGLHGLLAQPLGQNAVGVFLKDLHDQRLKILIVVIKRVAVDAAVLHHVAHRDLADRALVEELQKGFLDRFFRE